MNFKIQEIAKIKDYLRGEIEVLEIYFKEGIPSKKEILEFIRKKKNKEIKILKIISFFGMKKIKVKILSN